MARILTEMKVVLGFIATIWVVFFVSIFLPINRMGIVPREVDGLIGIPLAVFLHADLHHLIANTVGLLTFGLMFALVHGRDTAATITVISLLSGSLTWCFARSANHFGASGLVFGLYAYLIAFGIYSRRILPLIASLFLILTYGSIIFGVLPTQRGISWESHLTGAIVGWCFARYRLGDSTR